MTQFNTATADAPISHQSPSTRLIAGVSVSDTPLITAVIDTRNGSRNRTCSITRCVRGCSQKRLAA